MIPISSQAVRVWVCYTACYWREGSILWVDRYTSLYVSTYVWVYARLPDRMHHSSPKAYACGPLLDIHIHGCPSESVCVAQLRGSPTTMPECMNKNSCVCVCVCIIWSVDSSSTKWECVCVVRMFTRGTGQTLVHGFCFRQDCTPNKKNAIRQQF